MWRSEDMVKVDIVVERDYVRETIFGMGCTGYFEFLDAAESLGQTTFQRPYASEIRRLDDLQRRLRYFALEMSKTKLAATASSFSSGGSELHPALGNVPEIEQRLDEAEKELRELNNGLDAMFEERTRCREMYEVLRRDIEEDEDAIEALGSPGKQKSPENSSDASPSSSRSRSSSRSSGVGYGGVIARSEENLEETSHLYQSGSSGGSGRGGKITGLGLMYVAGVVADNQIPFLQQLLFRVSRGNFVFRVDPIAEPFCESEGAQPIKKSVFAVYVSSRRILEKARSVVQMAGAHIYEFGLDTEQKLAQLRGQLLSFDSTLDQNRVRKATVLAAIARHFLKWWIAVECEKQVLITQNMFQYHGSVAAGQAWISRADLCSVNIGLESGSMRFSQHARPIFRVALNQADPPTKFPENKFTTVFQGIVSSYGTPRYKEINPAVFTIVTFPYLFGVMFGDIGHGIILMIAAMVLILREPTLTSTKIGEITSMIFSGRYLILAMGFFGVYFGLLYNDFFGLSLGIFTSAYEWPIVSADGPADIVTPFNPDGRPNVAPDSPYAFGVDVSWTGTDNKLEMYNSVKMKCAVIIGVLHMLLGLCLSLMNDFRERNWRSIVFCFIPEFLFLGCTFGYMCLTIIIKWCRSWTNTNDAPSLLETMTNFFLSPGSVNTELFPGQTGLQLWLFLLSFMMVPVLLLGTPLSVWIDRRRKRSKAFQRATYTYTPHADFEKQPLRPSEIEERGAHDEVRVQVTSDPLIDPNSEQGGHGEEEAMSEILLHNLIHTIEFVLGSVSNTASYLRLWALSLAHAQLSEVFLDFGLVNALSSDSGIGIITIFGTAVWFGANLGILCVMESLSAFLHALRLHWVEFQNKFYKGDGTPFRPLNLSDVAKETKFLFSGGEK